MKVCFQEADFQEAQAFLCTDPPLDAAWLWWFPEYYQGTCSTVHSVLEYTLSLQGTNS